MAKKKWWQVGNLFSDNLIEENFSNTIKQHQRKFDQDGIEYFDEEEYYSDWGLDRKLMDSSIKNVGEMDDLSKEEAKNVLLLGIQGKNYEDAISITKAQRIKTKEKSVVSTWQEYNTTGHWKGYDYYRQPKLSYKYVQQMANAFAVQHKITVQVGNNWNVDLINKKLTYNPASLIYGTKSELLATLMHEIGKIRYCTHSSLLQNKYITMYKDPALEVLSIYEDVRVDFMMLKAYESASEVYESIIPSVQKQVDDYVNKGRRWREAVPKVFKKNYEYTKENFIQENSNGVAGAVRGVFYDPKKDSKFRQELLRTYGESNPDVIEQKIIELENYYDNNGCVFEYCGEMLTYMYDLDTQSVPRRLHNIIDKAMLCIPAIEIAKKKVTSQEMVNMMDSDVYPHIEDLLKDFSDKNEAIEKAFPNMPKDMVGNFIRMSKDMLGGSQMSVDDSGNVRTRNSGQSNITIPPEWTNGDYKTLKDSVAMEIKQLVNKLTYLRREEMTVKYQQDQKRGKLNSRKLYKTATGSRRLFKQRLENIDTIRSFAFSVLMDVSGSMNGSRIVHTTRAVIILAEVFKRLDIPFEFVIFDNGATTVKSFEQNIDKKIETKIGGLAKYDGGGTNLSKGLDQIKIKDRTEKNKIVIVLTDGGVGDMKWFDSQYFEPWSKKGLKSVGFGIECEDNMKNLCMGNSKVLTNSSELPVEFSRLLKDIIKRK